MPILESKGDPSTISRILAFLRTLFRRHPKTGGETEMVPTRAAGTRKRLAEAKACLESLDAERESPGKSAFGKSTEDRIVWTELLDLELQDLDEKMESIKKSE